jgi:hypothetical protein
MDIQDILRRTAAHDAARQQGRGGASVGNAQVGGGQYGPDGPNQYGPWSTSGAAEQASKNWCGNPSNPRLSMVSFGANVVGFGAGTGLPVGDTTYEIKPKCGAFLVHRLYAPSGLAGNWWLMKATVGVTEQVDLATNSLTAPNSFQGIAFQSFSEAAVNVFQQTVLVTSICPIILTVRNTGAAAQTFNMNAIIEWISCA